jgi:small neutral amino acid transporter SnatA (MarC family)
MLIGAIALCLYSISVCHPTKRRQLSSLRATMVSLIAWLVIVLGGEWLLLG